MVPYFGPLGLLQVTVRSVLAQEDVHWSLTVVDDAYPDAAVAAWFMTVRDDRIRYTRNKVNLGANRNFQRCLDLVENDLVVIVGCDDVLLPNYVSTIRASYSAHPGVAMVQPRVQVIDSDGFPSRALADIVKRRVYTPQHHEYVELSGQDLAVSLLRGNWLYFPSVCWRSAAILGTGFRAGLDTTQDLALVLDLVGAGETLLLVPVACFQYRRHAASESSWRGAVGTRFQEERGFFLDVAERMEARGWYHAAHAARWHISSRLNAMSVLPHAVRNRQGSVVRSLAAHAVGPPRRRKLDGL